MSLKPAHSPFQLSPRQPLHSLPRSYTANTNNANHREELEEDEASRVSSSSVGKEVCIAGLKTGVLRYYGRTLFEVKNI